MQNCDTDPHSFYPSKSSSFNSTNQTAELEFDEGFGVLGYDTVSLSEDGPRVTGHPLALMQDTTELAYNEADGVIVRAMQGLALQARVQGSKTLVETLKEQGVIDMEVFAIYLTDYLDQNKPQSSLSFGSWDLTKYALSDFSWFRIKTLRKFWVITLNSFKIEKTLTVDSSPVFVSHTEPMIIVPYEAYEIYRSAVCGIVKCGLYNDGIMFDCPNGEEESLPDMIFKLDNTDFPLSYKYYILKVDNSCFSLVFPINSIVYMLGSPFLRAYYAAFDKDNYQIGFARSINYPYPSGMSMWTVAFIAAITVALIVGVVVGYCLYRRKGLRVAEAAQPLMHQGQDF